jgi:CubicO group peptidase (beta-lactamase class C family)
MSMWKNLAGAIGAAIVFAGPAWAEEWPACGRVEAFPRAAWREVTPSRYGWDEAALARAQAMFESTEGAAVMVVHRGRLIASWGAVDARYTAQSVRKALINSLVGQLVGEGRLRTDQTLTELGIDDSDPALTDAERQATVRNLLMSRSGIFHSALYEVGGWARERSALRAAEAAAGRDLHPPGAYWIYNNWDFNALGTIVERTAGEEIGPLFARRVAEPIGMQDFRPQDVEYTTREHPAEQRFNNVSDHRAYVFDISTRDLARYGLLYLNCGAWRGRQVVPRAWVLESLDGQDTREGRQALEQATGFGDYGYLWQIDREGSRRLEQVRTREPFYIASGNRGHMMIVLPYLDLVVAHQVATVGGVSPEAQMRRFTEGSPEVQENAVGDLVAAIIAAHPDAQNALLN